MAGIKVYNLAKLVGMTPEKLVEQLKAAGVSVSHLDTEISDTQKKQLMLHLSKRRKEEEVLSRKPSTLSLSRSAGSLSNAVTQGGVGTGASVRVEVLRKRRPQREAIPEEPRKTSDVSVSASETEITSVTPATAELQGKETKTETAGFSDATTAQQGEEGEATLLVSQKEKEQEVTAKATPQKSTAKSEKEDLVGHEGSVPRSEKAAGMRKRPLPVVKDEDDDIRAKKAKLSAKKLRGEAMPFLRPSASAPRERLRNKVTGVSSITQHQFEKPTVRAVHEVIVPDMLTVSELAQKMSVKAATVIKTMMQMGVMVTINQVIDKETAALVVEEMGHRVKFATSASEKEAASFEITEPLADPVPRAPVVTIMGHVDHGKTSLLDFIRRTRVTAAEAGGITQHIGAYHVTTSRGSITFLDTPGHAAFTAMRARGAQCTDIVVLVVAADDGVMPQTIEAIQHAKAAEVPIIVAVNKMDKEQADPERVKSELSQYGVMPEEWGGDTLFQYISAKTGEGVEALLESISLQAELLELVAIPNGPARGLVIESALDRGRGAVATVLVTQGRLCKGDIVLAGKEMGRVRAMVADNGQLCEEAGPSLPVEILGLSGVPAAGDAICVLRDETKAREVAASRQEAYREKRLAQRQAARLEAFFDHVGAGAADKKVKVLNLVLKTDVQGSLGAISDALQKLSAEEVKVNILLSAVGSISESDAILAQASHAIILGFNVRADQGAMQVITKEKIQLRYYSVIYELLEDIKQALSGMLAPRIQENILGLAEIREVFRSSKYGVVSGCMVTKGVLKRSLPIRILRNNVVIYEGELESLRHFKEDVQEVRAGMECGIGIKRYDDVKVRDQIECYERVSVKREL